MFIENIWSLMKNFFRITVKTLLWIVGIAASALIILEVVLSSKLPTRLVNKIASEYIDGDIHVGAISASVFRRFPATTLTLEDFHITYPSDRFDLIEKAGVQGHLMHKGCFPEADTLASFKRFSVGVNLPALIGGTIKIPYMRLDQPRIFAHSYADGSANWNIFVTGSDDDDISEEVENEDTTATGSIPRFVIGKIMMTGRPHIVYTDSRDTVFALVNMKRLMLNGKIRSSRPHRSKVGLTLDSMFVAGRLGRDTIAAGLDRLYLHEDGRDVAIDANAKAFIATSSFGRVKVPISINGVISFPDNDFKAASTDNLNINILDIPVNVKADVALEDEISFAAKASIPQTAIRHPDFPEQELELLMDVRAMTDSKGRINVDLDRMKAGIKGLGLSLNGSISDVLGKDPLITANGALTADIDSLARFVPDSLEIEASGKLSAKIDGSAYLSQLDIYNFSKSSMTGEILGDSILVKMPKDTINARINGLHIVLGPEERVSRRDSTKSFNLMGISGDIANADVSYKDIAYLKATGFQVSAKNVIDEKSQADTTKRIYPFSGRVNAGTLIFRDSEGSLIRLNESSNSFNIFPKKGHPNIPVLTLSSRNKKIFFKSDINRAVVSNANIRASAAMNTVERRQKMKAFRDSLARVYPDVPKDSLFLHMRASRSNDQASLPEWMKEDDFKKKDIDISLDKRLAKYFRDWDLKGQFKVENGIVMTPYFPLRNTLDGFDLNFTNDKIAIDQFKIKSGDSDISMTGELTGLRRALLGRKGTLQFNADILSQEMNADQLLTAYRAGSQFNPETFEGNSAIGDEEFMDHIEIDSTEVVSETSILVIPANLNAHVTFFAGNTNYSDLHIDLMTADLTVKERCILLTNTQALSNMGEIDLEGFYATRSKKDLKTGFSINFKDITAEKVINLMPSIDTLMPLLKSFGGMLNCEVAATADLDTNMNVVMPSINGIMRIGGEDLTIKNSDMFRKFAKLLLFKNKKEGHIDKMTVEGVIKDSKVEIFPFILEMDRYMLGLSGVQNMDMSYRYHASLIKSPFLIKLGMDIYGQDFDNMKFKLGRAKYKNRNVPVFSTVIDNTKFNLVTSIRNVFNKGVDNVMKENRKMNEIEEHKKSIGYIQAVDQKLEELSADEQLQLEQEQEALNTPEQTDSLTTTIPQIPDHE